MLKLYIIRLLFLHQFLIKQNGFKMQEKQDIAPDTKFYGVIIGK